MPRVIFKLSTGEAFSREVESDEDARAHVKSFFNRQEEYLGDWIKVDGDAYIARSAIIAVEVIGDDTEA
jgi:hypothetical protein